MWRGCLLALVGMLSLFGSAPIAPAAEEEEHDEASRLVKSVDEDGRETCYRYDDQGQLVEERSCDGAVEVEEKNGHSSKR